MPHVPNADLAIVETAKLLGYILNPAHKVGWAKGRFLESQGFDPGDPESVRSALLAHIRDNEIADSEATPFGTRYRVDGLLSGGLGLFPAVRTVWQVDTGQVAPRFVTMRPARIASS